MRTLTAAALVLGLALWTQGCGPSRRDHAEGDPFWSLMLAFYDGDNRRRDTRAQRRALVDHASGFQDWLRAKTQQPLAHSWPVTVETEQDPGDTAELCSWPRNSGVTGCTYPQGRLTARRVVVWAGPHNRCDAFFHELAHVNAEALGIDHDHQHALWTEINAEGSRISGLRR